MVENTGSATLIGRKLGNYAVETLLGRGAAGIVYLAHDTALGRPVALKVLLGALARNPEHVTHFLQEAKAVAPLQHPNIVGVYEAGIRDGTPYIAMEYIEGEALDKFLRRSGVLDWRHAFYIVAQVLEALHCAHKHGVVHRDVKPANILIDPRGCVRLTDFGIARMQQDAIQRGQGYRIFGTPEYMSPEQCGSPVPIGPPSDLFSVGVMLFQMISGRVPFTGESTAALVQRIVNDTAPRLSKLREDVPDDVARLVAGLLEKSPTCRPASALTVLEEVRRIQHQDGDVSVVGEALSAFIRDMAAPLEIKVDTPMPGVRRPLRVTAPRLRPDKKRFAPVSTLTQVLLVLLLLAGGLGVVYWHLVEGPQPSRSAVQMDRSLVSVDQDGKLWAQMPADHWLIDGIYWVGDRDVALVAVTGRPGTVYHGSRGVLAVSPSEQRMTSVGAPVGPMLDNDSGRSKVTALRPGAMPPSPSQSPLANAIVVPFLSYAGSDRTRGGVIQALAQRWDASEPGGRLLFSLDEKSVAPADTTASWQGQTSAVSMAAHPDGKTICLLLFDNASRAYYLVEREVQWRDPARLGRRLVNTTDPIAGASIRYSDDGRWLAYERIRDENESTLWVVDTWNPSMNGVPIATGELRGFSFSPDGSHIAITRHRNEENRITLFETETGNIVGEGGVGQCDLSSWHPTLPMLVVQARDEDTDVDQLWSVSTGAPYSHKRLTELPEGTNGVPAISRSGRWIATVASTYRGAAALFIPYSAENSTMPGEA